MGDTALNEILLELERAISKWPAWPTDPLHAMAIVHEEVGELGKEVLQFVYEPHKSSRGAIYKEAIQAAAMLFRFIRELDNYHFQPGQMMNQDLHRVLEEFGR